MVGKYYNCEPYCEGTDRQRKAYFALLEEFWVSGCHSYDVTNFEDFKFEIKRRLGVTKEVIVNGEKYIYVKSFSEYTKKERREIIDRLIVDMDMAQVQTAKYYEIRKGMENGKY